MTCGNGYRFEGYFFDDAINGKGVEVTDGETFDGSWVKNRKHGEFKCTSSDGTVKYRTYKKGEETNVRTEGTEITQNFG